MLNSKKYRITKRFKKMFLLETFYKNSPLCKSFHSNQMSTKDWEDFVKVSHSKIRAELDTLAGITFARSVYYENLSLM